VALLRTLTFEMAAADAILIPDLHVRRRDLRRQPQQVMRALIEPCATSAARSQGDLRFGPILAALQAHGYGGICSVAPFVYEPDGPTCAARAAGCLQGLLQGREEAGLRAAAGQRGRSGLLRPAAWIRCGKGSAGAKPMDETTRPAGI
jgi:hypothetical protein